MAEEEGGSASIGREADRDEGRCPANKMMSRTVKMGLPKSTDIVKVFLNTGVPEALLPGQSTWCQIDIRD